MVTQPFIAVFECPTYRNNIADNCGKFEKNLDSTCFSRELP